MFIHFVARAKRHLFFFCFFFNRCRRPLPQNQSVIPDYIQCLFLKPQLPSQCSCSLFTPNHWSPHRALSRPTWSVIASKALSSSKARLSLFFNGAKCPLSGTQVSHSLCCVQRRRTVYSHFLLHSLLVSFQERAPRAQAAASCIYFPFLIASAMSALAIMGRGRHSRSFSPLVRSSLSSCWTCSRKSSKFFCSLNSCNKIPVALVMEASRTTFSDRSTKDSSCFRSKDL